MTAACIQCGYNASAPVLARWEFTIPRDLPSLNQRIHNGRQGWRYREGRDAWLGDFRAMRVMHRINQVTIQPAKRRVTLIRLYSKHQREMDRANIDTKACVDAMVKTGLLSDDAPRWLELHVKQERGKERGTRVIVEELSHA